MSSPLHKTDVKGEIRVALDRDLNAIMHLQERWKDDVGRLQRSAQADHIQRGDTFLINHNNQEAGYLLAHCGHDKRTTIIQVAVHADLLRTTLGTQLMTRVLHHAIGHHNLTISLRTRVDLPANLFWPEVGYYFAGQAVTRNRKRSLLNTWVRTLTKPVYVPAGILATRAGPARRNRGTPTKRVVR